MVARILHTTRILRNAAMPGPSHSHTQTQMHGELAMMKRPLSIINLTAAFRCILPREALVAVFWLSPQQRTAERSHREPVTAQSATSAHLCPAPAA